MHLKIFSLFKLNEKWQLTPAYDLLNSAIYMKEPEYLALALMGKRKKIQRQHFIDYFAKERLGLPRKITSDLLKKIYESTRSWEALIEISFMSLNLKEKYAKEV
jgi:serine/threonine-protein kinase HipA